MEKTSNQKSGLSREEFVRIANKFGSDMAVQCLRDGGDYASAMQLAYAAKCAECDKLRRELVKTTGEAPAMFAKKARRPGGFIPRKLSSKLFRDDPAPRSRKNAAK